MRLLHVDTFEIQTTDILKRRKCLREGGKYAIVSLRWTDKEITSQRYKSLQESNQTQRLRDPDSIDYTEEPGLARSL